MTPRVSYVVASYNYGRFVARAIDSMLGQTFDRLEVIVIDDGSTDETPRILEQYANEPRVRLLRNEVNQGHVASRATAFACAQGEYVGVLDADDFAHSTDAVARQVEVLDANPDVGFVYSSYMAVFEGGKPAELWRRWDHDAVRDGYEEFAHLVGGNYILHSGTLVRRSCRDEIGGYDPRLPHDADWDLWLRLAARYRVGYVAEPLWAYRFHGSNMHHVGISPAAATAQHVLLFQKAFDALPPMAPLALRQQRGAAMQRALLEETNRDRGFGRTRRSWEGILDALRRSPGLLMAPAFHGALGRLIVLTVLGSDRYAGLARFRHA